MKAYYLSVKDEDDAGQAVVFATSSKEAKKQVFSHDELVIALDGGWINLRVNRAKRYDGLENSDTDLALAQWKDGWRWFDRYDMPDPDTATDQAFLDWYRDNG